jgi:hypothetical protein
VPNVERRAALGPRKALAGAVECLPVIAGIEFDRLFLPLHGLGEIAGVGVRCCQHLQVIHRHSCGQMSSSARYWRCHKLRN